ncbi:hypothetical protein [Actinomadura sp. KC06]|uniref:hypothetical protein n=1 Tax=Actinomadura sp. KC06 TaxID=2530369 RepID=UPI001FB78AD7|nr:hypothetical protein [Actinomadura sp. KC06]
MTARAGSALGSGAAASAAEKVTDETGASKSMAPVPYASIRWRCDRGGSPATVRASGVTRRPSAVLACSSRSPRTNSAISVPTGPNVGTGREATVRRPASSRCTWKALSGSVTAGRCRAATWNASVRSAEDVTT